MARVHAGPALAPPDCDGPTVSPPGGLTTPRQSKPHRPLGPDAFTGQQWRSRWGGHPTHDRPKIDYQVRLDLPCSTGRPPAKLPHTCPFAAAFAGVVSHVARKKVLALNKVERDAMRGLPCRSTRSSRITPPASIASHEYTVLTGTSPLRSTTRGFPRAAVPALTM